MPEQLIKKTARGGASGSLFLIIYFPNTRAMVLPISAGLATT